MQTVALGSTSLSVSRIAYGCMGLGGSWARDDAVTDQTRREAVAAVRAALDSGITCFDHADIYRWGRAEEAFAAIWSAEPSLRDRVVLQSKCGIVMTGARTDATVGQVDLRRSHIVRSVEGSLARLQTEYLDVLLLHRPDPLVEPEEIARAFDELHARGLVRHFGVSNHAASDIRLLKRFIRQPIVANQVELSLLHLALINEAVTFNQQGSIATAHTDGTLAYCREHDITLQAWAPLKGGAVITGEADPPSAVAREVARVVAAIAHDRGASPEAVAIAWLLMHPANMQVVIGSARPDRIRAACEGDAVTLSRDEWYRLFVAGRGAPMP